MPWRGAKEDHIVKVSGSLEPLSVFFFFWGAIFSKDSLLVGSFFCKRTYFNEVGSVAFKRLCLL